MSFEIEQIKIRLPISTIVGKKVALKSRGAGEFIGICPFHSEKTPSFTVSDNKGFYHCFGCLEHGDIFSFFMKIESCDYKTALYALASLAGVSLQSAEHYVSSVNKKHVLYHQILERLTSIYQKNLHKNSNNSALQYIRSRKINDDMVAKYRIGFAENYHNVVMALQSEFSLEAIRELGIFSVSEKNEIFDQMKGRVIFPIFDINDKVIAFGGRIITDGRPKYLNSSENPLFEKKKVLYGLNFAKKVAYKTKKIIIVEGYMDVISCVQAGFENVVAPLGTALRYENIIALWEFVDEIIICFDSDEAGAKSTFKVALEVLPFLQVKKHLRFVSLNGYKDPDELIASEGKSGFNNAIANSLYLSEFLLHHYKGSNFIATPESKSTLKKNLEDIALKVTNVTLRSEYSAYFKNALYQLNSAKKLPFNKNHDSIELMKIEEVNIVTILYVLAKAPELLKDEIISDRLVRLKINNKKLDQIRDFILNGSSIEVDHIRDFLISGSSTEKVQMSSLIDVVERVEGIVKIQTENFSYKEFLMRVFELQSISVVQQQRMEAERMLIASTSVGGSLDMERLERRIFALKEEEAAIRNRLNVI